jgi:hypothetical protein
MSIALAALIIALASLLWNVVSTAYSWKFNRPAIRIVAGPQYQGPTNSLKIDVQNRGGAAIAVTGVAVYWEYEKWWERVYFQKEGWLARKVSRSGIGATHPGSASREDGTALRYVTIQPYHAQTWTCDRDELIRSWVKSPKPSKKFVVQVSLATGKRVTKKASVEAIPGEAAHIASQEKPDTTTTDT